MASRGSCPEEEEEREEAALRKLTVRLRNVQEGTPLESLLQTLEDLLALAHRPRGRDPAEPPLRGAKGAAMLKRCRSSTLSRVLKALPRQCFKVSGNGRLLEFQIKEYVMSSSFFLHARGMGNSVLCFKVEYLFIGEGTQEAACWALNNLLMYQCNLYKKIGDEDKQYPIHREAMLAMLMHSTAKEVFQAAANALATLSEQNVNIRKVLLAKGIHINALDIMKKHSDSPEVAESACKMLNHVFEGSFPHLDIVMIVASEVIKAMRKHGKVPSVQLEALRVILPFMIPGATKERQNSSSGAVGDADLMLTLKVIKNQCLLEGTHTLVLDALNRFIGNPGIQKCGLKILSSVVECSGALQMLSQQGATDTILHTLQMYPDDQEIQCLGLSLLGSLITRKSLCIASMHVLATVLVSTLRRFKEVVEIQIHGFHMILTILDLSPCFAKLLIYESFDTVIFYQMSMCFTEQRDQQFQSLCCKCFAKIANNDDLKNMMLEKACAEYNSIMAECLLLLGADVNKNTKTSSLIYQVCEKGSNPKLVELLLTSGAREQDVRSALTVSIKKGDSQIISLLLRKLSLDVANSSICLGGFCIGRIEPSWLSPLFPNKLTPIKKQTNAGSALARMVLRYQMKSFSEDQSRSSCNVTFSEDALDKSDWIVMPELLVDSVFLLSDDIDSEGSEGSFLMKKKYNSIAVADLYKDTPLQRYSPTLQRHSNSLTLKCLTYLDLHSNQFASFPTYLLKMNCIANLDISRNEIGPSLALDPHSKCPSLKQLNLSYNQLSCIPKFLVDVAENLEQLMLEGLRSVDLSDNKIINLPGPMHWKSLNLRELLFNYNQIDILDLNEKAYAWSRLEKLHLSHNKLKEIPPQIGFLENLTSLDVSYNPGLSSFPDEMGKLSKVWDLPLDGLHLNLDFNHVGCKARDIIRFLQQRLKKAVPYNRMKLMIVGNTGSGKTTLLQQLMKCKRSDLGTQNPTIGIDVKDWSVPVKGKVKKDLILNVWDFAGQEEFYSTHPHFMTQRALYLAVYDLSKGQAEVDAMKPWLFNIKARASSSPVILVGTHLDVSDEKQRKACLSKITRELLNKRGFPAIQDYHFVNATEESDAMIKLRKTIIKESLNFKIRDQPVVGQLIPDSYLELEKIILFERENVPTEFPVIDHKRLLVLVQESQLQLDENELPHAVYFLNESDFTGETSVSEIGDPDPKGSFREGHGIATVTSVLPSELARERRLLARRPALKAAPRQQQHKKRALRPNRMYWRQGVYLNWSPEAYCLVESAEFDSNPDSFLKITAPSCRKGCILLGQVVDHIDSLMEEWFPGLLDIDVCGEGETLLKKWALCSFEDGKEHQKILLDDLLEKAEEGDLLVNPDQPRFTIPIAQIAPDLILADLPRNIMLNNDELEFDQAPEFLLGDGGFGSVYRASYGGEEVAVKIFNKHTSLRILRQELAVLCHLHHPSLVSLLAAAIRPRMLVMELAPKGSLDRLLQQDSSSLTKTLQHRIALHVADGLRYLHSSMIIYRDLKPHNVLLFTLYPNSAVIAKIADYGIAQYCCRMGIKTSEGTPGFRAPEVARGNVIYNQQADVYSFGLLLYDILTAGGRIIEGMKFPNEFDELAIHGKLPDPVKEYGCAPWPELESLISKCLKENPEERPTSAQVYDILNSAKLICLMRHISIRSAFAAECMVAANQSCKKAGVWIGTGNTKKGQVSFIDLNTDGHTYEDIADGRILCLALVTLPTEKENWIVAGTQSGSLWAFNTEDGKNKHHLQKMSDSVTCLYCNFFSKQRFCHKAYSDANIISIAVDKSIYLAKKNSHFVEVWDKKTERLCELIDCAHFLKEEVVKLNKESKHTVAYSGRVKTIYLQKNTALWIGTGGGHILLLDLSTHRPIRIIRDFCASVRVMLTAQLELQSCMSVWDIKLPHEVQNLKKHIEVRQELAEKMRSFSLD
ncbi:Leucine-rich repeat serine/threonine-protein kinase 2 [Chelonia mydas]|uniref:non-specific serine/threonine protein kinase n=1 Tax=Chelonia mydas TaxID=8469 RepID=M7BNX1_CHEMY|nr:Leucine-rich repeat serine/threonine-protein kinase 2 [Chelonia mydas]